MDIAIRRKRAFTRATDKVATVAFVVNGGPDSAMGFRARDLATRLPQLDVAIAYRSKRKFLSLLRLVSWLVSLRPGLTYVFDISYTGVLSAGLYRLIFRNCLIIETGDAITELARSLGERGRLLLWLTAALERTAFWLADRVVVRGSYHREWLSLQGIDAAVIQDGVDTSRFSSNDVRGLRKQLGLDGYLTVGLIGSSVWSEKLQMCYGWELVETLRLLRDEPVKGIMIGGGSGISHLKAAAQTHGIEDKLLFMDHVPYEKLPPYLSLIDICLSTQSNNLVGQVRTTGKLPLYLAAGRYILATDVGEAARVLDPEMLVPYNGVKDEQYPEQLTLRIRAILAQPELLSRGQSGVALAREHFDYSVLAERVGNVIAAAINSRQEQR